MPAETSSAKIAERDWSSGNNCLVVGPTLRNERIADTKARRMLTPGVWPHLLNRWHGSGSAVNWPGYLRFDWQDVRFNSQ